MSALLALAEGRQPLPEMKPIRWSALQEDSYRRTAPTVGEIRRKVRESLRPTVAPTTAVCFDNVHPVSSEVAPSSPQSNATTVEGTVSYGELPQNIRGANGVKISAPILAMDKGQFTKAFQKILHEEYGDQRYPLQKIAEDAGAVESTAKNWWEGRCAPGALHLAKLETRNPGIASAMRRLKAMEADLDPEFERAFHYTLQLYAQAMSNGGT